MTYLNEKKVGVSAWSTLRGLPHIHVIRKHTAKPLGLVACLIKTHDYKNFLLKIML